MRSALINTSLRRSRLFFHEYHAIIIANGRWREETETNAAITRRVCAQKFMSMALLSSRANFILRTYEKYARALDMQVDRVNK